MLLIVDENHKSHLELLNRFETEVAVEFCKTAGEFLKKGVNAKIYHSAAQKLQLEVDEISKAIEGLMHLLVEIAKLKLNDADIIDSLATLAFPEELRQTLLDIYKENEKELQTILSTLSKGLPRCTDLHWRADIEISSRSLNNYVKPLILLDFELTGEDNVTKHNLLQTDPCNLVHMTKVLEQALLEAKSQHTRRIMQHIK